MQPKLGILAGSGRLPAQLIEACRAQRREFFVLAFEGYTDRSLLTESVPHALVRLGAIGRALQLLKEAGVGELTLAGHMKRPSLLTLRPDREGARWLAKLSRKRMTGDDALLSMVIEELEKEGFGVVGADSLLGTKILATEGIYGLHRPDEQAEQDIAVAAHAARVLGELDIGQAVVVQQGLVLGVEAAEGTAALLARCGGLRLDGPGGVLVKLRKPGQEARADLPTIGPDTVEQAVGAGLCGIAIEAGGSLVIDRDEVVRKADVAGLFVTGIKDDAAC